MSVYYVLYMVYVYNGDLAVGQRSAVNNDSTVQACIRHASANRQQHTSPSIWLNLTSLIVFTSE